MKHFTWGNPLKIILATIVAILILGGGFAFAKTIPSVEENLINFNKQLIKDYQAEWGELEEDHQLFQEKISDIITRKKYIEKKANIARETISVLMNGEDFY